MRKTVKSLLLLVVVVGFITGCATSSAKYVPDWARTKPEQAAGVEHLVDRLARGEKNIITLTCFLPPALFVEMRGPNGYFIALSLVNGKLVSGDAYFERMDTSGIGLIRVIMPGKYDDFANAPTILANMDGGFAFTLTGKRVKNGSEDTQYDVLRFNKEHEYRQKFFSLYGITPLQMNKYLRDFFKENGVSTSDDVFFREEVAGTQGWINLEHHMQKYLGQSYELHNGKNYLSRMDLGQFQVEANRAVGFTATQRYSENIKIPFSLIPMLFTPVGIPGTAAKLAADITNANLRTEWPGPYARATGQRSELMEQFEWWTSIYLNLLQVKEEQNRYYRSLLKQNGIKY